MEITTEVAALFAGLIALGTGAVRIIERLIDGVLKKKDGKCDESLSYDTALKMSRQIYELWDWHRHDVQGEPGVKVWWCTAMRKPMEELQAAIDRLSESVNRKK